jgi:hypothetical protein
MVTIEVDVDLDSFDDEDLIDELEDRGYDVYDSETHRLTEDETRIMIGALESARPGTPEYFLYEKLVQKVN